MSSDTNNRVWGISWFVLACVVWLVGWLSLGFLIPGDRTIPGLDISLRWLWWGLVIPYALLSLEEQAPTEWALVLFWGSRIALVSEKGPVFVPRPLFSVIYLPKTMIQDQYPGESDDIYWGEQSELSSYPSKKGKDSHDDTDILDDRLTVGKLPPGKVWPLRVITGGIEDRPDKGNKGEGASPLSFRMAVYTSFLIAWRIKDPVQYISAIGDLANSLEEGRRRMRDLGEGVLITEFAKRTPQEILADQFEINLKLEQAAQKLVEGIKSENGERVEDKDNAWGAQIVEAQIVRFELPYKVNLALRDVPAAELRKTATATEAQGTKIKKTLEGQGDAAAREALLTAEAAGRALLVAQAKTEEGQLIAWLETIQTALRASQYSLIPGTELFAAVGGIQQMLTRLPSPRPELPPIPKPVS